MGLIDTIHADHAALSRLARKVDGAAGAKVNSRTSLVLHGQAGETPPAPAPALTLVLFKVTGSASGGGKYNGKTLATPNNADVSASGTLAESDFGELASANNVLALNLREVGKATHDLSASTYLPLLFIGWLVRVNLDGTIVVAFDGLQWEDC